ncbi:SGNH/GDSL hydrolase family protein [Sunxiuqinia sp. A32]|uniref:SGNH/GDSL hydrolase family protein n=1 Tax=Sunxiuqinia sp. A32 TaxID=3461496 RepID=UPI0040467796
MNIKKIFLLMCACLLFSFSKAQQAIPAFKSGERVVFVGNSITHGGHYHSFIWLYYMTRFPGDPVTVMNAGIGGECSWDMKLRMDEDIFDREPTYVALTFGMNDTDYGIYLKDNAQELSAKRIKKSYESYLEIEKRFQSEKNVTKVLIGGSPYDETSKFNNFILPQKNEALLKVNDFQRESAEKNKWGFVDFNRPMLEVNKQEQAKDSTFTLCGVDRIHPDNDGQMVMAYLFLKAQGLAGKKVAEVSINASNSKVEVQGNCQVSGVKISGDKLEFDYLANSLPYPIDTVPRHGWGNKKSQRDALELVPFMEKFNQEILKVTNLEEGSYRLMIDDQFIAEVSSTELQKGINLACYPTTPQYQQATKVMFLNEERFEVEKRFREYFWTEYSFLRREGLLFADNQEAIDKLREYLPKDMFLRASYDYYTKARYPEIREVWKNYMDAIVKTIYKINQPTTHKLNMEKIY